MFDEVDFLRHCKVEWENVNSNVFINPFQASALYLYPLKMIDDLSGFYVFSSQLA